MAEPPASYDTSFSLIDSLRRSNDSLLPITIDNHLPSNARLSKQLLPNPIPANRGPLPRLRKPFTSTMFLRRLREEEVEYLLGFPKNRQRNSTPQRRLRGTIAGATSEPTSFI
ncbi:hypothetical protein E2P81_ATG00670 [Venturia nashicola]|nr:hypothetical protein E2P81_ATG00670 [Venturia nashicola]